MGVFASRRGRCSFKVLLDLEDYCATILRLFTKENVFPKRYRWCIGNDIVDCIKTIVTQAHMANDVRTFNEETYMLRKHHQQAVVTNMKSLLVLLRLAYKVKQFDIATYTNLVETNISLQYKMVSWINDSTTKYKMMSDADRIRESELAKYEIEN